MFDLIGRFIEFVGAIVGFFARSLFVEPGEFIAIIAASPGSSIFEILFVAFLLLVAAMLVIGLARTVVRRSPFPFIHSVEYLSRLFGLIGGWIIVILIVSMVYEGHIALLPQRPHAVGIRDGLHADGHELHVRHRVVPSDAPAHPGGLRVRPREPAVPGDHRSRRILPPDADAAVALRGTLGLLPPGLPGGRGSRASRPGTPSSGRSSTPS